MGQTKYAIDQLDYVIENGKKQDYPLIGFVYYSRARAYGLRGQRSRAISDYKHAIESNPKYLKAYGPLIDLYIKQGEKDKALLILEESLKLMPKSKSLLKRQRLLRK